MQDGEGAEDEQEHRETAEKPEKERLISNDVAKPIFETALVFGGLVVEVAAVHLLGFVLVYRAHQGWHPGPHADVFLAQVVGVVKVPQSAGAGENHRAEEAAERQLVAYAAVVRHHVHREIGEIEEADRAFPHVQEDGRGADLPNDVDQADDDDDDQDADAAFDGRVDDLGAEQNHRHQGEDDGGPEPRRAVMAGSEDEIAQRDTGLSGPARQELADEDHEDEQIDEELEHPRHAGERALAGNDGPAANLDVHPELQEDADGGGPKQLGADHGSDPRPHDEFAGADGEAGHHDARADHLVERCLAFRQIGFLERRYGQGHGSWFFVGGLGTIIQPEAGDNAHDV